MRLMRARMTGTTGDSFGTASDLEDEVTLEYLRRAYANNLVWYSVSETKAQILVATNGALISVFLAVLIGGSSGTSEPLIGFGPETWILLVLGVVAIIGAVASASLCMWSRHGRPSRTEFARMGVDPRDSATYPPVVLWYFGDLAHLDPDTVAKRGGMCRTGTRSRYSAFICRDWPHGCCASTGGSIGVGP